MIRTYEHFTNKPHAYKLNSYDNKQDAKQKERPVTYCLTRKPYEYKIEIDKKSDVFHLITRIQDEAHRFAINYHRKIRGKGIFNSILDEIEGIGPKTKEKLLKKYKSVNLIKFASIKELTSLGINEKIALNLIEKLKEN